MDFQKMPIPADIDIQGFHSIYYFEFSKNFFSLPEKHDFWELVYVDDGAIRAIVDGMGCTIQKGQVIFHRPMEKHCHGNHEDASNIVVISFSCNSSLMNFFNKKVFTLDKHSERMLSLFLSEAKNALGRISGEYKNKSPLDFTQAKQGSVQLMQCYLVAFLYSLIRSNDTSVQPLQNIQSSHVIAETSLAEAIQNYMKSSVSDTPSLSVLCNKFSMSKTNLCRLFKESTGTSPVDYWIYLKITEAKKRIRQGNDNITQISEQLGYSSIHHFSRMFKRVTGLSPTAYKKTLVD